MRLAVDGREVYAYTGARTVDPALPTVVFVHGAANDHSVFALQSRYFAHHGRNAIAVDLPGHGRSAGEALESVEALAQWLAALIDALQLDAVSLVGHSMGALVCLQLAGRRPASVAQLALLGPAVPMAVNDALIDAARRNDHVALELINGWSHSAAHQLGGNRQPGLWMMGQSMRLLERTRPGVLHTDLVACQRYSDGLAAAASVRCATLLVLGGRDQMAPPRNAAPLAQALQSARTVTLPGIGHSMMTEAPDAVLDALRGFV
jgi:pimeloyl-ACP methyl ester carboxylesterase